MNKLLLRALENLMPPSDESRLNYLVLVLSFDKHTSQSLDVVVGIQCFTKRRSRLEVANIFFCAADDE
jgi:hypothetical protein